MSPKDPDYWKREPEYVSLMIFLIKKTSDAKSPLSIKQLAEEFKEKMGSSQSISCLIYRIRSLRGKVAESDLFDATTKVKMAFALSSSIDENFLKGLQEDADVEIDENHRITKYKAKYSSFELKGDHTMSAKMRDVLKPKMVESEEDSDDASQDSMLKTPGSVKRSALEVPNSSSKKTRTGKVKTEDFAPDDFEGIPSREPDHQNPGSQLLREPKLAARKALSFRTGGAPRASRAQGLPTRSKSEADGAPEAQIPTKSDNSAGIPSREPKPDSQLFREPKLEEPPEASGAQEAPIFRIGGARKTPRAARAHIPREIPIKTEPDAVTAQNKLLEAMIFLVSPMEMPSLSPLQAKIEQELQESSSMIPNDKVYLAMEVLVTKIINYSVPILSEPVNYVTLKAFLCYLKAAILNSKLQGLEALLEKIREIIMKLASKDKNIPVEKVESALQAALDVIGS